MALTSLSISLSLGAYTRVHFSVVHAILSGAPIPRLRQLTISINLHRATPGSVEDPAIARNVPGRDCAQLEALLMQKYRVLESLVFDLRDMMNPYVLPQDVWGTIQESMPQLRDKGVLIIHPRLKRIDTSGSPPS